MEKDKDLDNLFKKGLHDPAADHSAFVDDDWDAMEQMLNKRKKRPAIIYWLPALSGMAALLLIVIGWWLLKPVSNHPQKQQTTAKIEIPVRPGSASPAQKESGKSGGSIQQVVVNKPAATLPVNVAGDLTAAMRKPKSKRYNTSSAVGGRRDTAGNNYLADQQPAGRAALSAFGTKPAINASVTGVVPTVSGLGLDRLTGPVHGLQASAGIKSSSAPNKPKASMAYRTQFALHALASSDLNGVNSLQQSKVGDNFGLLFTAGISKKFTISTGVVYSSKPYMSSFADYHTEHQFATDPETVTADCRMLDIPVNIDYQLYNKHQNKFSIGTGISSYLMLHESYQYNYAEYDTGPASYTVRKPGKYFLSIVNLQATYERQVNSKFGLSLQPYLKLPISNVGAGQVRLQTTGVALGVSYNLNRR